ncbi:SPL family radical SAM protein [Candidatus Contubernalis alkaliaceticus]|uniref:SPL family radical SAM protein n=1 Tax=Candidatus Contubernalis alkaliaceticus TaxID=338645 RepID=UPI001F4C2DAB|nr:radical SAM protein [Candidatus Contubernalis alkalaceticus]UNC93181.1 radical SAM protein [Candidatus Contubernalis alkalaceticus]
MRDKIYKDISCEVALNRLKRQMPYCWDLNIYRGCEHGCKYCYAIYSHDYLDSENYFGDIYVKINIIEQLEKQLRNPNWKREIVNIGGVTDSYQPAEKHYKLMPEILKLLIKFKTPAIISTKSDLILRDFDLIDELSKLTYINVAATITTVDEELRKLIEPGGVESTRRFKMLKTFKKTNASIGLHVMPIIPYLTDSYENIDSLFHIAKDSDVDYVLPGTLYLRGKTRTVFFDFIRKEFPNFYYDLVALYKTGGANKEYKNILYKTVNEVRDKYSLSSSYSKPMKEKLK